MPLYSSTTTAELYHDMRLLRTSESFCHGYGTITHSLYGIDGMVASGLNFDIIEALLLLILGFWALGRANYLHYSISCRNRCVYVKPEHHLSFTSSLMTTDP